MSNKWFTADTHFGHERAIKDEWRKFQDTDQMDEMLIENWNSVVKPKDDVYHLGDFKLSPKRVTEYLDRLNGRIHLILGNHDYKMKAWEKECFESVQDILYLKPLNVFLCHYPMRTWHRSHYGTIQLLGHTHGMMSEVGRQVDVGVDCWDFKPISLEQAKARIERRLG